MAESKAPPRYTIKHVDGVMHMTIHPEVVPQDLSTLRSLPPTVDGVEAP